MRDRITDDLGEKSTRLDDRDDVRSRDEDTTGGLISADRDRFRDDASSDDRRRSNDPFGTDDSLDTDDRLGADDRLGTDALTSENSLGASGGMDIPGDDHAPLFSLDDSDRFRARWKEIQTNFVDEPRRSVEEADELVAEVTERLTSAFTTNRSELERQWTAGDEVSTENLRQTLKHYRSFFERLLSM